MEIRNDYGRIVLSDEYLKSLVRSIAFSNDCIEEIKSKKGKSIKITGNENAVEIEMHIAVKFGCEIRKISKDIEEKVKRDFEGDTGITVSTVSVFADKLIN